ncbi:hypothetical protein [Williamsia sp. D3]|uniref:hypothetical protein n=1 Tax=Williamsia sp. D3 TaxID=1313067 RepID=UPI0003D31E46|nr:hypothetical protein [Williamsia sp. D3]ETD31555.1 hypothetical protein W823_20175 [Williamsia sp. D3]
MTTVEHSDPAVDRKSVTLRIMSITQRRLQPRSYYLSPSDLESRPAPSADADAAQARYLARELEGWIRRLEWAADHERHRTRALVVHREIEELKRQINALRNRFPGEFD